MIIKIVIADNHTEYVKRLVSGLQKKKELSIFVYNKKESFEEALRTRKFDIILFTQALYDGRTALPNSALAVMLTDGSEEISEVYKKFYKINKYQRISTIYSRLLNAYADICQNTAEENDGYAKKIIFYSPMGGSGKTTIALAAARRIAMQGKSVLYLSFEDIPSDGDYLEQSETDQGISELLSCLEKDSLTLKLQGLVHQKTDNFYYLNHFSSPNDIYELTPDEIQKMIKKISNTGLYDYLMIDTETALNDNKKMLFECADKIVVISRQDEMSAEKMKCFANQLHILNEYGEKMSVVVNQAVSANLIGEVEIPVAEIVMKTQEKKADQIVEVIAAKNIKNLTNMLMQV